LQTTAHIYAVGLATAQGSAAELLAGVAAVSPEPLPWPAERWTTSYLCRPARGLDPGLAGTERWRALARRALAECCAGSPPAAGTPLVVATCNGAAPSFEAGAWREAFDTSFLPWAGARLPVVSAACASGLHGLFLARLLLDGGADEVVVLAVDILSVAAHANFEALRILSPRLQAPWQPRTEGFLFGEAAVALRLRRGGPGFRLRGPVLSQDLNDDDSDGGLGRALDDLNVPGPVDLILGQGTGPPEVDGVELAAVRRAVPDLGVALTTPLFHFGHTLGASGLLGVALAVLHGSRSLPALALPASRAADGRVLLDRMNGSRGECLVVCRALGGACAAAGLHGDDALREPPPVSRSWASPVPPGPIHHPLLRRLAEEALRYRPPEPPDLLVVRLSEPLTPPPRAVVGGRLLPGAVLEITPGRTALQVAQGWGYQGPALCLVGASGSEPGRDPLSGVLAESGRCVSMVYIDPGNDHVQWS
jgi:hypothetical protein